MPTDQNWRFQKLLNYNQCQRENKLQQIYVLSEENLLHDKNAMEFTFKGIRAHKNFYYSAISHYLQTYYQNYLTENTSIILHNKSEFLFT